MAYILLVPGFWLGAWAWDEVADDLRRRGNKVHALTLPGLDPADPERLSASFETQARAILDAAGPDAPVLVSHSGGALPAYLATDIAPERFSRTVYVDTAPMPDGYAVLPGLGSARELPLPDWERLQATGNSIEGLDEAALARFRERAVSEPASIAGAPLKLSDSPARLAIPATIICTSYSSDLVRQLRDAGELALFAELARIDAEYIDLPTGHWPMWSRPAELAELIHTAANP
ncbi:alpha/beta fold hydrolase [Nocardia mexicana]|uniref:Pimeloyl-ACP methyl ester carboxylesterase n=1 Tax=Nocardia mexicana TaxID=279262 RepID=A0A370H3C0_9NOCA|nr:alpha/beta fold hydrolase [Nocardia mexicana]RDI49662.1 pimeloyl-ACP methyl ester carboxylesterase [Nocardia mexicana]